MKCIEVNRSFSYVFHMILFTAVACFPVQKPNLGTQPEIRDEKHFPNGTTIGKYTYMDNDGNPIQVKYYADEASYGVELKSIKVVDRGGDLFKASSQPLQDSPNKFDKESDAKMVVNLLNADPIALTYKNHDYVDPYDFLNKEVSKTNRYKVEKPNSDYDIFYQNELKGGKKCASSKDKVRVYFDDKEHRKIRSAVNNLAEANKFCEQF